MMFLSVGHAWGESGVPQSDMRLQTSQSLQGDRVSRQRSPFSQVLLTEQHLPEKSTSHFKVPQRPVIHHDVPAKSQLQTAFITVQYAKTEDLVHVIQQGKVKTKLLSEQGQVTMDPRTNTLVVIDTPGHIAEIRRLVQALDVPVKQVQIEARIVTVNEGGLDELGIRWGVNAHHSGSSIGTIDTLSGDESLDKKFNVSLPATSSGASALAFQLATLGSDFLLDMELSALESESKANIVSSPSLLTTNHQPAFIEQGSEIPYTESSAHGNTSVAFKKAVLSLKVTPNITPDNHLILDLQVTQDRPGDVVQSGSGKAVAIITQRLGTQVLVNQGETVVLGGIQQHSEIHRVERVPVLGSLPLIGRLFRHSYQQTSKSELLIFVTPKVVIN